jgi:glucose dehydrogenase
VGGVDVRTAAAHLLVAAGMVLVTVAVWLLSGRAWALLAGGVLLVVYGLLLVNVPERPERAEVPEPGAVPLGSAGASRAGR